MQRLSTLALFASTLTVLFPPVIDARTAGYYAQTLGGGVKPQHLSAAVFPSLPKRSSALFGTPRPSITTSNFTWHTGVETKVFDQRHRAPGLPPPKKPLITFGDAYTLQGTHSTCYPQHLCKKSPATAATGLSSWIIWAAVLGGLVLVSAVGFAIYYFYFRETPPGETAGSG